MTESLTADTIDSWYANLAATAAVAVDPQGDEALESLREERRSVLPFLDSSRRVMAFGRS